MKIVLISDIHGNTMKALRKLIIVVLAYITISCGTTGTSSLLTEQTEVAIAMQMHDIMSRPEFEGARWGMEFYAPATGETIFSFNIDQYFLPASSMKIFPAGTAIESLGVDYRFRTPVYRTGNIENGVLYGDLIMVASGDLLLGGRVAEDGTLRLPLPDHTYDMSPGAMPVSDDPLGSMRLIADQVAAHGIKRIEGYVRVDNSLFQEEMSVAGGTGAFMASPMVINDNLIGIIITPGDRVGALAELRVVPETSYLTIVNQVVTVDAGAQVMSGAASMGVNPFRFVNETINTSGTLSVELVGEIPMNNTTAFRAFRILAPTRFAEIVLTDLLRQRGIEVSSSADSSVDFEVLSRFYTSENLVAELVSPPLDAQLMPMLKLSSNPHTAIWYYLIGAIAGGDQMNANEKGLEIQQALFNRAGVVPNSMVDPANVIGSMEYTPGSFTRFLTHVYRQPYFQRFKNTLPILGVDGSLSGIFAESRAAGHVYAKTGGAMNFHRVGDMTAVRHRHALAGFIELPNDQIVVFSTFLDYLASTPNPNLGNQVMGEIVNMVYTSLNP
jgi:D-alanyl-D-alanine carboxypeptidase/D-alanyl-D-alanine-endopeptidase (penicillin-binding protein 4)